MAASEAAEKARIFIDGDACPVKDEALKVAARHHLPVVIVSNGGLRPSRDPNARHVVVAKTADAADDWIVDAIRPGEIVVTADIPLAARVIAKEALALAPNGRPFTPDSIGMALAMPIESGVNGRPFGASASASLAMTRAASGMSAVTTISPGRIASTIQSSAASAVF